LWGKVFTAFREQDSGCVAFGVETAEGRFFVKAAREARAVPGLLRASKLGAKVSHPALPLLRKVIDSPRGPVLVYDFVDAEGLNPAGTKAHDREDPAHPHARFRALPVRDVLRALDTVYDLLLLLAGRGYVGVDWYDGCLLHDFRSGQTFVCDLDEFREGPFTLEEERLPGSTRFMAPEEFARGSLIDQVTNVFSYARTAEVLLQERITGSMKEVVARATQAERTGRYPSVQAFVLAWREAAWCNTSE
jgi:serine/threonine-protein kinase